MNNLYLFIHTLSLWYNILCIFHCCDVEYLLSLLSLSFTELMSRMNSKKENISLLVLNLVIANFIVSLDGVLSLSNTFISFLYLHHYWEVSLPQYDLPLPLPLPSSFVVLVVWFCSVPVTETLKSVISSLALVLSPETPYTPSIGGKSQEITHFISILQKQSQFADKRYWMEYRSCRRRSHHERVPINCCQ